MPDRSEYHILEAPEGLSPLSPTLSPIMEVEEPSECGFGWQRRESFGYTGASFWSAVFSLSTSVVGAGIMGLPAAMKTTGLIPGLALVVLAGCLANASVEILVRFSRCSKTSSYGGVMEDSFGRAGRMLLQVCLVINNFGMLVVYTIIIADVLSGSDSFGEHHTGVFEEWAGVSTWWNRRFFVMFATTVTILAPLSFFKHVDSLKLSSALSVGLAVLFVVVTAGITVTKLIHGDIGMPKLFPHIKNSRSFLKLFEVVPVLVTVYVCHHSVHPILNELRDSSQERAIIRTSLATCTTIYVATNFFAFLLFGEKTLEDVLLNFDTDLRVPFGSVLSVIVRLGYAAHLTLVFPLIHFSLRLNLDGLLFPGGPPLSQDTKRFSLITSSVILLVFLAASLIPSIWYAFQFTGATAAVCLGFIFPGIIVLRNAHGLATRLEKVLSWFMVALAVASNVAAIINNIYNLVGKDEVSDNH